MALTVEERRQRARERAKRYRRNNWQRVRAIERCSYRKHRRERIAYTMKWIADHRDHVNRRQNAWTKRKRREDPVYRERERQRSRDEYRKHRARYMLRNIRQSRTFAQRARMHLQYMIRIGKMPRPERCDACKSPCKPHGHHHRGYENALDVIWLCSLCHAELHR